MLVLRRQDEARLEPGRRRKAIAEAIATARAVIGKRSRRMVSLLDEAAVVARLGTGSRQRRAGAPARRRRMITPGALPCGHRGRPRRVPGAAGMIRPMRSLESPSRRLTRLAVAAALFLAAAVDRGAARAAAKRAGHPRRRHGHRRCVRTSIPRASGRHRTSIGSRAREWCSPMRARSSAESARRRAIP